MPALVTTPRVSWPLCPLHDEASGPLPYFRAVTEQMRPVKFADELLLWLHFFGLDAHATAFISWAVSHSATDLRSVLD